MGTNQFKFVSSSLKKLSDLIKTGSIGTGEDWVGADVEIHTIEKVNKNSFYPENRFVLTEFSKELSWLFFQLRDIFYKDNLIDFSNKEEFFGRLANAANRYIKRTGTEKIDAKNLLLAVIHEAYCVAEELFDGVFKTLLISSNNTIYDDLVDRIESKDYLGPEKTEKSLKDLLESGND